MNVAFLIARKYFFSKKKKKFINIISIISMAGVAIGTMALIIVLSVFNGLEDLIRQLYGTFSAELKVVVKEGKSFEVDSLFLQKIAKTPGVKIITEVIEDDALLVYKEGQMFGKIKGVSENFSQQNQLETMMVKGKFLLQKGEENYAIIGRGVQYTLSIPLENFFTLQIWYPKNKKKVNVNPENNFNRQNVVPVGIFSIEQQYDEQYIIIPLRVAQELTGYKNRRTALEIKAVEGISVQKVQDDLQKTLGDKFLIQNRDEQQASLLKAIRIEKFFVYFTLSFILGISSFNIFFSLSMLAIEKKKDIAILYAMGASKALVRKIFITEGAIIAFSGAFIGILMGTILCLLQQKYKLVSMGMHTAIIEAYPVKLQVTDFLFTFLTIIFITIVFSFFPARAATKVDIKTNL